ncbi:MAG: glycosyltransferase, partial [Acidobacteria bacterium]|nr:glycosyltransferase [Acidobacteriota bacterium]
AAGVPVLVCASGAIPEVIVDGQNGFLLPSPSPSAIARRLRELVPQRDRLATAAEAAHRLWRERFTAERYREEVWRVVESAVPASKRRNTHAAERPTAAVDIMTTE